MRGVSSITAVALGAVISVPSFSGDIVVLTTIAESFERGFGAWTPDTFINCGPECVWESDIAISEEEAYDGRRSVRLFGTGNNDDGTLWIERPLDLAAGAWTIAVDFQLFWPLPDADIGTWEVVAAISPEPIEHERDLAFIGVSGVSGWSAYSHEATVTLAEAAAINVAVGVNIIFENELVHFIDAVTITISPALNPADLDGDGDVDGADLGELLAAWGPCEPAGECPADLNGSGDVDGADLGALLAAWS
jgi:hypothetical protein